MECFRCHRGIDPVWDGPPPLPAAALEVTIEGGYGMFWDLPVLWDEDRVVPEFPLLLCHDCSYALVDFLGLKQSFVDAAFPIGDLHYFFDCDCPKSES